LRTTDQGVYAGIVRQETGQVLLYVGSSYGKLGLQNRVFSNHLRPTYRAKYPFKALYSAMDKKKTTTSFILLAQYSKRVEQSQILLQGAICCFLFGSFGAKAYRELRAAELPEVDWKKRAQ